MKSSHSAIISRRSNQYLVICHHLKLQIGSITKANPLDKVTSILMRPKIDQHCFFMFIRVSYDGYSQRVQCTKWIICSTGFMRGQWRKASFIRIGRISSIQWNIEIQSNWFGYSTLVWTSRMQTYKLILLTFKIAISIRYLMVEVINLKILNVHFDLRIKV